MEKQVIARNRRAGAQKNTFLVATFYATRINQTTIVWRISAETINTGKAWDMPLDIPHNIGRDKIRDGQELSPEEFSDYLLEIAEQCSAELGNDSVDYRPAEFLPEDYYAM